MSMTAGTAPTPTKFVVNVGGNPVTGTETLTGGSGAALAYFNFAKTKSSKLASWPTWIISEDETQVIVTFANSNTVVYLDDAAIVPDRRMATKKLLDLLEQFATTRYNQLRALGDEAESVAEIVNYFVTNAELSGAGGAGVAIATITNTDAGLQRDNTGGNPATLAPASTKTINVTGGIK